MTNLAILLLACSALQNPSNPPVTKSAQDWILIDQVVAIVNQDILTYRKLMRDLRQQADRRQIKTASELQALQTSIHTQRVKDLLSKQAGQDMGADEKLVERNVQDTFDRYVQNQNGVVGMSKVLQVRDMTSKDVKDDIREKLYARVWTESVTGEGPGLSARPNRDRYVRPGEIKFRYERALHDPEELRRIGGSTETVTLQTLTLDSDKNGGRDATLKLAREIQQSIARDADMNELVRKYSASKVNDGVSEPLEIARLRSVSEGLARFIDGRPSDPARFPNYVSEPIPVSDDGSRLVVRLTRIRSISPGVTPQLGASSLQNFISTQARDSLDEYRLESAFASLYRAAYVWPPELSGTPKR